MQRVGVRSKRHGYRFTCHDDKKQIERQGWISLDFITYMKNSASDMKPGTASIYVSAANALKRYTQKNSIDISEITSSFIAGFIRFIETEPSQRGFNRKSTIHKPQAKGNRAKSSSSSQQPASPDLPIRSMLSESLLPAYLSRYRYCDIRFK